MTRGGKNLILLGVGSVCFTLMLTGVSLVIYHNSGDIYLDRSRPGFLPDKEEISEEVLENNYVFDKNGPVDGQALESYIVNLQDEMDALDVYKNAYSADGLSDEKLGL